MAGENGPAILNGPQFTRPYRTLKQLRDDVMTRLGFAAQLSTLPSGMQLLLDSFIKDAHKQLYYRYPLLRRLKWWTIAVTNPNRFYDVPYTGAYSGQRNDIAFVDNDPAADTITTTSGDFVSAGFTSGTSFRAIGSTSNDDTIYTIDTVTANTITLVSTDAVTAETAGAYIELKALDFTNMEMRDLHEAWVLDGTTWSELVGGIPAGMFNTTTAGRPTHVELREFIEIWPVPNKAYTLYLKAHAGLEPFGADTDTPSIDEEVLFLYALANAKAHYGQADANAYYRQAEVLISKLNSGNYDTRRFIPYDSGTVPGQTLSYPSVTFPRT